MAEMKKYNIDLDSFLIENEEESRDSGLELPPIDGNYITLIKNGGIYYINVDNLVAIFDIVIRAQSSRLDLLKSK